MKLILSLLLLFSNAAEAARVVQADILEGQLSTPNWTVNPSCRANTRSITASAGSITRITADNARLDSETACRWAAAGAGNTLEFTTNQMPRGYAQGNCEVSFRYFSGVGTFTARAVNASGFVSEPVTLAGDGSNLLSNPVRIVLPCGGDYTTPGPGPILRITAAGANSIDVAMVQSGPVTSIGQFSSVTEWQPFTTAQLAAGTWVKGSTTNPTYGTVAVNEAQWRKVGGNLEVIWTYRQTAAGTAGSGQYELDLTAALGLLIDTTKVTANSAVKTTDHNTATATNWFGSVVGSVGSGYLDSVNGTGGAVYVKDANRLKISLNAHFTDNTNRSYVWNSAGLSTIFSATNFHIEVKFSVPIQGWSASQSAAAANQTDFGLTDYGVLTFGATTTPPTKGTTAVDKIRCRRRGEFLQCFFEYRQTGAGVAGSGDYLITVPGSFQIDTNKVTAYATVEGTGTYVTNNAVGYINATVGSVHGAGHVSVYDGTRVRFFINDPANVGAVNSGFYALSNATLMYHGYFEVPISGWAENQRAPTLIGSVTSNAVGAERIERVLVSDTGVVSNESGDWINGNCTNAAPTVCTFNSGTFSATPVCVASGNTAGNTEGLNVVSTSTTVSVQFSSNVKRIFSLICMGPR